MKERQRVLLTGATGALGPALAAELLASDPRRTLEVLIRPSGSTPVSDRFDRWLDLVGEVLEERGSMRSDWRCRARAVAGDVRSANLGLAAERYRELSQSVNTIVHAAADTQFLNSFEDLWDTNVEGTRRVLDFASACRSVPKTILVSTVCTSGTRTGLIGETFEPSPAGFVNNYERTKWEAERLALSSGVPLGIARVSIVMGSHASGAVHRSGALHHIFKWFTRGFIPAIPGTRDTTVDLISTETVGQFIARALTVGWPSGAIWHIAAGAQAAPLGELVQVLRQHTHPGERFPIHDFIVDHERFEQIRESISAPRQRVIRQALDSISSFMPGMMYPRTYDTSRARELWGGELPCPDWRQTLVRMLDSCGLTSQRQVA